MGLPSGRHEPLWPPPTAPSTPPASAAAPFGDLLALPRGRRWEPLLVTGVRVGVGVGVGVVVGEAELVHEAVVEAPARKKARGPRTQGGEVVLRLVRPRATRRGASIRHHKPDPKSAAPKVWRTTERAADERRG